PAPASLSSSSLTGYSGRLPPEKDLRGNPCIAPTGVIALSAPTPAKPADKYHVARPQGRCVVTGRQIEPDEKFMAALRETPEGFERLDVSMDAWQEFDKTDLVGFWQTTMPHPEQPKKKLFVDDEVLRNLFERLQDTTEPAKQNFRFVLG